ncbi:MAG: hypothetical protein HXY21_04155, partial [Parvularculaceae bacterium]|nr:hypothetical protein [Parvularculaceae bacterium]
MRLIVISALALAASGCALFSGGENSTASLRPALTAAPSSVAGKAAREPFTPAFGIGRPVALIPCQKKIALSDDCRSQNERHQIAGSMPPPDEAS